MFIIEADPDQGTKVKVSSTLRYLSWIEYGDLYATVLMQNFVNIVLLICCLCIIIY